MAPSILPLFMAPPILPLSMAPPSILPLDGAPCILPLAVSSEEQPGTAQAVMSNKATRVVRRSNERIGGAPSRLNFRNEGAERPQPRPNVVSRLFEVKDLCNEPRQAMTRARHGSVLLEKVPPPRRRSSGLEGRGEHGPVKPETCCRLTPARRSRDQEACLRA